MDFSKEMDHDHHGPMVKISMADFPGALRLIPRVDQTVRFIGILNANSRVECSANSMVVDVYTI